MKEPGTVNLRQLPVFVWTEIKIASSIHRLHIRNLLIAELETPHRMTGDAMLRHIVGVPQAGDVVGRTPTYEIGIDIIVLTHNFSGVIRLAQIR